MRTNRGRRHPRPIRRSRGGRKGLPFSLASGVDKPVPRRERTKNRVDVDSGSDRNATVAADAAPRLRPGGGSASRRCPRHRQSWHPRDQHRIFTDPAEIIGYLDRSCPPSSMASGSCQRSRDRCDGKFLGMSTLMFGVGLELQRRSACARPAMAGPYPWRAICCSSMASALPAGRGVRLLMGYAVTGVVVAAALATSPRSQRVWMWTAAASTCY